MSVSKAHIKASNEYNKKNYKKFQANISYDDYELIDNYCKDFNISKSQLVVNACKAWIETHPVNDGHSSKNITINYQANISYIEIAIANIAAGAGVSVSFSEDNSFTKRRFLTSEVPEGADCGIPINGESMEPNYPDGCIVWVHETEDVKQGEVVIAILNGEPLCKIYEEDGLHSYNPKFETIHISHDDSIKFFGKVIGYLPL